MHPLYLFSILPFAYRFPRVLGEKFGDKFGDEFVTKDPGAPTLAMWPIQLDQPVAVRPKSGPPGLAMALLGPQKGLYGPKGALLWAPGVL